MLDRGDFWSPAADALAGIDTPRLRVRLLPALAQLMISGDLGKALAQQGLSGTIGLMEEAQGEVYMVRLARNRALLVGQAASAEASGYADGLASTPMTGALAVLELSGPNSFEAVQRASAIDFRKASPCAALNFAGVTSILYRKGDVLRLHLDRGLVPYMMDWLRSCGAA